MSYISIPSFEWKWFERKRRNDTLFPVKINRTAGIIGGIGPQSTSLFYDAVTQYCLEHKLPDFPRIIINSINTWDVTKIVQEKDLDKLYHYLYSEIKIIEDKVDFLAIVCNSVHAVINPMRDKLKIPVLTIYEEVCEEIERSPYRNIGIIGTKTTVKSGFYQKELQRRNIQFSILPDALSAEIDHFIFEEMLHGRGEGTMKHLILNGIDYLSALNCDAVILACTEFPLFVAQSDTDIPLFFSTQILAQRVVQKCLI